jgi:hypothetical protein
MRRLEKKPIELSVHPRVLAALREDARAAASLLEQQGAEPPLASPIAAWLIGVSLGETARGGTEATRAVGVVRATPGRTLSEDLGAFFFFFFFPRFFSRKRMHGPAGSSRGIFLPC